MPRRLAVTEAVKNFYKILGRIGFRRERFILLTGGKPVAELGPAATDASVRLGELPAILEALPHLEPEDADCFALDLESGRSTAGAVPAELSA